MRKDIKSILFILPSNTGDILLSLPSVLLAGQGYPDADITCAVSPANLEFFKSLNISSNVIVFDKKKALIVKLLWIIKLFKKFDVCIDLKNSFIPYLVGARIFSTPFGRNFKGHKTMMYRKIAACTLRLSNDPPQLQIDPVIHSGRIDFFNRLLPSKYVFFSPCSKSSDKRFPVNKAAELIDTIIKGGDSVVLTGSPDDYDYMSQVINAVECSDKIINLTGQTTFSELFFLFKNYADIVVSCDSAPLHAASIQNKPVMAVFASTDPLFYGPFSEHYKVKRLKRMIDIDIENIYEDIKELKKYTDNTDRQNR